MGIGIVAGGLRDDFCAAGGGPLVGWMTLGIEGGLSNRGNALGQRFPNPSPSAFRARVDLIGRKFGFHVVSLRLLRPEQIAPLLVVQTDRPRKNFVNDVPAIVSYSTRRRPRETSRRPLSERPSWRRATPRDHLWRWTTSPGARPRAESGLGA